jgi:hypothetical protein
MRAAQVQERGLFFNRAAARPYPNGDIDISGLPRHHERSRLASMDLTHVTVIGLGLVGIAVAVIGLWMISRQLRKDEAIDAATFLALRQLEEFVRRTKG